MGKTERWEYREKVGIQREGGRTEGRWECKRKGRNKEGMWEYRGRQEYMGRQEYREKVRISRGRQE
jgi:hypothetical protein